MPLRTVALWLAVVLIPIALLGGPALADTLRFGYDEYPPLSYTENGEARGRSIELVREASRRLGIEPEFVSQPFVRLLTSVEEGTLDGMVDLYQTPERTKYLFFAPRSATGEDIFIYVRAGSGVRIESVEDIRKYRVGAVRGYYYGEMVDRELESGFDLVKDCKVLYGMLLEGRLDAVLGNSMAAQYYMRAELMRGEVLPVLTLAHLDYHVVFSRILGPRGQSLANAYAREIRRILEERGEPVSVP